MSAGFESIPPRATARLQNDEAETSPARYIYLDVVGFSTGRSVEAQAAIVGVVNGIVLAALGDVDTAEDEIILLPTGDGMCMAILGTTSAYDAHLTIALALLDKLAIFNETLDERIDAQRMRQFRVRIGINSNVDNVVTDVNGRRNMAGAGINLAQRIMTRADGGQILLGYRDYEALSQREKYMTAFKAWPGNIPSYQFIGEGHKGLDRSVPSAFRRTGPPRLSEFAAHYLKQAILAERFTKGFAGTLGTEKYALIVWLYFRAIDSQGESKADEIHPFTPKVPAPQGSDAEQLASIQSAPFYLFCNFSEYVVTELLGAYSDCFDIANLGLSLSHATVSEKGRQRLRVEWPELWSAVATK